MLQTRLSYSKRSIRLAAKLGIITLIAVFVYINRSNPLLLIFGAPIAVGSLTGLITFWVAKRRICSGKPNSVRTAVIAVVIAELIWFSLMFVTLWDVFFGDYQDTPGAMMFYAFLVDSPIVAVAAGIFGAGVGQNR